MKKLEGSLVSVLGLLLVSGCGDVTVEGSPGRSSTSSTTTRESTTKTCSGGPALFPVPDCDVDTEDGATRIVCGHQGESPYPDQGGYLDTYFFSVTADAEGALIAIERGLPHLVRITPEGAAGALAVPVPVEWKTELAADASGAAYAVQRDGDAVVEVSLDTMAKTVIPGSESFFYRSDTLLVAPDGAHHVFSAGYQHFIRSGAAWTSDPIEVPSLLSFDIMPTIDARGERILLGQLIDRQVAMVKDDVLTPLGPPATVWYAPVPPTTATLPDSAPRTVVVVQHADGLRVVWPSSSNGQGGEVFVPAPLFQTTCPTPEYPNCHDVCHDTGAGVVTGSFAAARATDGAVWLSYVESALDVDRGFAGEDEYVEMCFSQRVPETDQSTARLHVVRVSLDTGEAEEVSVGTALPEPGLDYHAAVQHAVRMRADRDRLAIAVREHHEGRIFGLRVMQIDMKR